MTPSPGGHPFREVVPYEVELNTPDRIPVVADRLVPDRIPFTDVRIPGGEGVHVDTPDQIRVGLPINNVSVFEKRWKWALDDMYPAWVRLVGSGAAGDLVATGGPGRRAPYHPRLVVPLRARPMKRLLVVALLLAALVAGCTVTFEEGEQVDQTNEAPVKPVWDLRNSHRIEDVGWPEGHDLDVYHVVADAGQLKILLPAGVVIEPPPEGRLDVFANRPLLPAEGEDDGVLEYLVVNYDREPVRDAARRAAELARQWGIDASRLAEWAARNADGRDKSPGGSMATTGSQRPTEDGPSLSIDARALTAEESYLSVTVSWYEEGEEPGLA